jgi:hypothetical protein
MFKMEVVRAVGALGVIMFRDEYGWFLFKVSAFFETLSTSV